MIPSALAVYSSKGGVAKTTMTLNIAVAAARAGWAVLCVDLDPQGNLGDGLGYADHPENDLGESLMDAVRRPDRLRVLHDVRPGLDCVPGGPNAAGLADAIASKMTHDPATAPWCIDEMLAGISDRYDLILFDLPPTPSSLHTAALTSVHWLIVPTTTDTFAKGALTTGFERAAAVRASTNPELEVLAAVITRHERRLARELSLALDDIRVLFGDAIPVLDPPIRHSQAADSQMKRLGIAACEFSDWAKDAKRARLQWLREHKKNPAAAGESPEPVSSTAGPLAKDYQRIVAQVIELIAARMEHTASPQKASRP